MIPRTLVPWNVRPLSDENLRREARRRSSELDERVVIPRDLPAAPLDPKSSIPAHVPLDVLAARVVVPRDTPARPLERATSLSAQRSPSALDFRVVVPREVVPAPPMEPLPSKPSAPLLPEPLELLEPDVITTGQVNLLSRPVDTRGASGQLAARSFSLLIHAAAIAFLLFTPRLFPPHVPTQAELELARRQLSFVYLPPWVNEVPKIPPRPAPPSNRIRVDPRILRELAPPSPAPGPEVREMPRTAPELPAAPSPRASSRTEEQPASRSEGASLVPHFQPLKPQPRRSGSLNLSLPKMSPGRALEESLRGAMEQGGGRTGSFADPIPGGAGAGGGGAGQGLLGGGVQILTPTEGVDFTNYLARLLASVKRNWYAVIPESARLGEKGRVILQFHILRDGAVPFPEPVLEATSGKDPLDRAAMAAIRASSPFEPLPPAFNGPYIVLRFIFLYNLPIDYQ